MGKIQATRMRSMQEEHTALRVEQCNQVTIGTSSLPTTNPYYCGLTTIALKQTGLLQNPWCISMYINIDMYIYIYICVICIYRYATVLPPPEFHLTKITQMKMIRDCWPFTDILKTCQATLDSMWCMNMSTSKIQCKTQCSSSPWNHNVFILKTYILYRCHHLDITMSAKRINPKKESN